MRGFAWVKTLVAVVATICCLYTAGRGPVCAEVQQSDCLNNELTMLETYLSSRIIEAKNTTGFTDVVKEALYLTKALGFSNFLNLTSHVEQSDNLSSLKDLILRGAAEQLLTASLNCDSKSLAFLSMVRRDPCLKGRMLSTHSDTRLETCAREKIPKFIDKIRENLNPILYNLTVVKKKSYNDGYDGYIRYHVSSSVENEHFAKLRKMLDNPPSNANPRGLAEAMLIVKTYLTNDLLEHPENRVAESPLSDTMSDRLDILLIKPCRAMTEKIRSIGARDKDLELLRLQGGESATWVDNYRLCTSILDLQKELYNALD